MSALDHPPAEGTEGRDRALAGAALLIAALVYWWRILADPSGRVAGGAGDPLLIAYLVTWVAEHLGDPALWNPPFFHPATGVLAYSDHLLGMGTLAWPLVQAGAPPAVIVNVLSIAGAVLTSLAIYLWLRDAGAGSIPAAAASLTVSYGAWRHLQLAHPQLLFTPFLPLALWCYGRVIERRSPDRLIALAAAALAAQTLLTPSLGVYMLPLVTLWLSAASLMARRTDRGHWVRLAASLAAVGIVNAPIAVHYWRLGSALDRGAVEIAKHSAAWVDWISAQHHWLYGDALLFTRGGERELFPGVGFALVLAVGIVTMLAPPARSPLKLAGLLTAAVALWAATGLSASGLSLAHLPYDLFYRLMPGGAQVRVPARFVLPAAIFLAPVIAAGWTRILAVAARRDAVLAAPIVVWLAAAVVAEGLASPAWFEPPPAPTAGRVPAQSGAVVFVPLAEAAGPRLEIERMWQARRAGVPLVNGYSGHESTLYRKLRDLQAADLDQPARGALYALLRHAGVQTIITDAPHHPLIDPGRLLPIADGVYGIPPDASAARIDHIIMGSGVGLVVAEDGWSYPERNDQESWVWTAQRTATLRLPMDGTPRHQITFLARSQQAGVDELELWWKGRRLGVQPLEPAPMQHTFRLPEAATVRGLLELELRGPAPVRLPGNRDPRALGVCVFEIRLD